MPRRKFGLAPDSTPPPSREEKARAAARSSDSASCKKLERVRSSFQAQQNRGDEIARQNEKNVDADPAEFRRSPKARGKPFIMADDHQQDCDGAKPVQFEDSVALSRSNDRRRSASLCSGWLATKLKPRLCSISATICVCTFRKRSRRPPQRHRLSATGSSKKLAPAQLPRSAHNYGP